MPNKTVLWRIMYSVNKRFNIFNVFFIKIYHKTILLYKLDSCRHLFSLILTWYDINLLL